MRVTFNTTYTGITADSLPLGTAERAVATMDALRRRTCIGYDWLGWLDLPEADASVIGAIRQEAAAIQARCDLFVVIGIGGSYIGASSALDFIKSPFYNQLPKTTPAIYFAGTHLDADALDDLMRLCEGREVCLNLVSKSGTTTEPAIAFRSLERMLFSRYGEAARERIVCTCGEGPLKAYAVEQGYRLLAVPEDVGGRYSVLSAVGLLPMVVAGVDIGRVLAGAREAKQAYFESDNPFTDPVRYAACRQALYASGRSVELMAMANPQLGSFGRWLQQLFAESEGKAGTGIFPVPAAYTADLHSVGQFVQQGSPILFETILWVEAGRSGTAVAPGGDFDGLAPLVGRPMDTLNGLAMQAVAQAHHDGGVPVMMMSVPDRSEETFGALVFFFQLACAVGALMAEVNPFDQPGVEAYKAHMKRLFSQF